MAFPVPSLADAERFVREKEAIAQYYGIMDKAREIMRQAYYATPEGKAEAKRERELAELRRKEAAKDRVRREEARVRLEAEVAEMRRRDAELAAKRAVEKAAREARTERDHERERRSRIKWSEIIDDEYIVRMQIAWERRTMALAMLDAGLSYTAIGERLGVTRGRANQLVQHALRDRLNPQHRSPAEKWMDAPAVVADYSGFAMRQTAAAIVPRDDDDDADWIWAGLAA